MQVTLRKSLPNMLLMVASLAGIASQRPANAKNIPIPGGLYNSRIEILSGDTAIIPKGGLASFGPTGGIDLQGGILQVLGALELSPGSRSTFGAGQLQGQDGALYVREGATLAFEGNGEKTIESLTIFNSGVMEWGGTADIGCLETAKIINGGTMYVANGMHEVDVRGRRVREVDTFTNRGSIILLAKTQGTIPGGLMNEGDIQVGAFVNGMVARRKHMMNFVKISRRPRFGPKNLKIPQPTVMLISGSGTVGQAGSLFTSTINISFYGQLASTGTININGGTLKYVLDPSTYVPANALIHNVLSAPTIGGTGNFQYYIPSGTSFKFDRLRDQIPNPNVYKLYSYN